MTREEFAARFHWDTIVLCITVPLNPFMISPQIYETWSTGKTDGISLGFWAILIFLQTLFSAHGFVHRDKTVMYSNGLAALSTVIATVLVIYLRNFV